MSLSKCIRKAGKALNKNDAAVVKELYGELINRGVPGAEAEVQAVTNYLSEMQEEMQSMVSEVERQGGDVSAFRGGKAMLLATKDSVLELAREISMAKYIDGEKLPGLPKKLNARGFSDYLTKRTRKLNRGKPLAASTPRNKLIIAEVLSQEVEAAVKRSGHAGNWYSEVLEEGLRYAALIHPELATDAHARNSFLLGMAITSNGVSVDRNAEFAMRQYASFKKNGGTFDVWGEGVTAAAMKKAFKQYNQMVVKWGASRVDEFLHTEFTVKELNLLGFEVSGENKDTVVYGSSVFGPKVGQAFFQNLSGNYSPLTMDRWWMRTWGRIVGNLAAEGMVNAENQAANLRSILQKNEARVVQEGFTVAQLQSSDKALGKFAYSVHKKYARGGYKDRTEINRASKIFDGALNDPKIAPKNGTERNWIREVVAAAQTKLKDRGMELNTASMQALLWYPEKELYISNGVVNERAKPTDYAIEFAKLAKEHGLSRQRITAARSSSLAGRTAGDVGAGGKPGVKSQLGPGLARETRKQILHVAAAREVANSVKGAYRQAVPKGTRRAIDGIRVLQEHVPQITTKNTMANVGLPAPAYLELTPSQEAAALFTKKINAAKKKAVGGEFVATLSEKEYTDARLFLTEDGLAGFALIGEELRSVFKHPASKDKGLTMSVASLAVEQGARRLGAYDTVVPHLYGMSGFRAVSRTEGMKGKDLIFMIYDRHSEQLYSPSEGKRFASVQEARAHSISESANIAARNNPTTSLRLRLRDEPNSIVDTHPDNPLSQLTKMAATMEDQSRFGPNGAKGIKASMGDLLLGKNAANVERVLGAIPRRNIPDFVSEGAMPAAKRYIQLSNRMEGRRNELLVSQEKIGKRWNSFVSRNKAVARILGELMHASTIAGVDPAERYKPLVSGKLNMDQRRAEAKRRGDYVVLRKWWDGMDVEGQEIYIEVRNAYLKQRTSIEKALMDRIKATGADGKTKAALMDNLRKQFESGRVAGVYFPLARFGELWASAKDANDNVIAFSRFEQVSEQREWKKNMKAEGLEVDGGKKMDDRGIVGQIDPGFVSKVTEMAKGVDPELADDIWQLYLSALPELSARKSFMHRKGRLGFTADAVRSFGHNMFHGSHQLSKLEFMPQLDGQMQDMKAQARKMEQTEDPEALWGNAVFREMTKRHDWAKNPQSSAWATKLTALGFAWYLGMTPAAAAVNMSQTAIVGLPVLSAQFGWAKSAAGLLKASADYASSWGPIKNKLRGDERLAMEEAERIGMFDKTQSHDLAGVAEQGMDYTSKGHMAMTVISWMFHKMEEFNRQVTFLASYRAGRERGDSHNDSITMAEDLTWDSHFDYNSVNRPRYMQGDTARVLLLFRQYSMNMTYRLARDFNDGIREADPKLKAQAKTRFRGMLGMTGLFAGVTGMPMFWLIEAVVNSFKDDEDEPYDFVDDTRAHLAEVFSPEVADIIVRGPMDYLTGATMSSRVSLNNLWMRETPAYLEGEDLYAHWLGEMAGPIPSIAKDVFFKSSQEFKAGNVGRGVEAMLPKSLTDMGKTFRYLSEGVRNKRGDVILPKEELHNKDLFLQASGFTPSRVTKQYEINRAVKKAEGKIVDRKKYLMAHLFLAARTGDKREVMAATKKIARFNKANPGFVIDGGNIIASGKSRARYSAESIGGVRLNKNLRYLHKKYDF